jgi:hypothetical protein
MVSLIDERQFRRLADYNGIFADSFEKICPNNGCLFPNIFMKSNDVFVTKIKTSKAEVCLLRDNLVKITVNDNVHLEAEDVIEINRAKRALVKGTRHTVLLLSGKFTSISKEAREISAYKAVSENRIAKAIVINSLAQRIIGDFFIRRINSRESIKLFDKEEEAFLWLRRFKV